jgi:RHS repeat-associated protein
MAHRQWRLRSGIILTILALLLAAPVASPDKIYLPLILKDFDAAQTPLAFNDQYQVDEGGTLNGTPGVLANDQDPKARPLTAVLVTEVGHGSLTFNLDGTFTYTPISDFNGTDSFTYKAYNGLFYSSAAMVRITVIPINGPPVAVPDVVGMTRTAAQAAIIAAKLAAGTESTVPNGTVPKDSVISQNPLAGTSVAEGTSVSLVVSLGSGLVTMPSVVGMIRSAAELAINTAGLTVGTITEENSDTVLAGYVISQSPAGGSPAAPGSPVNLTISLGPQGPPLPPDPSLVAPPLNLTVPTSVFSATEFIYTGTNPIQTGVTPGTIEAKRAAVLRGLVTNRDGTPLPGVAITILNHPEYGQTRSRLDGVFDLVVNGGGVLTVKYEKEGYLKAQRQADVPWQDLIWLPDVALVPFDVQTTVIDLSAPGVQAARGAPQTDAAGPRQATVLFPPGNQGTMVMPDGSTQPLNSFTLRATEYTVGPNGPQTMPAPLPPNVGYTYCVELTADEAEQAGAARVQFTQPLYVYLENFLGFPVGSIAPSGYYDRQKAAWIPSPNGRVIKIVGVTGDLADLDVDSNPGADPSLYASLGITEDERAQLASLYPMNQELWRVPITHFTPYDLNWPAGLGVASDATLPNQAPPDQKKPDCDPCKQKGSILECQSQVLGQEIPVIGSPFSLNYRSSHVSGRKEAYTLDIPLSGPSVPDSLGKIKLEVRVAGRLFKWNFSKAPNLSHTFIWDGKDAYGRIFQGRQPVNVRIGYEYPAVYNAPAPLNSSFGSSADITIAGPSARQDVTLWQEWKGQIGTWLSLYQGLGGFSLDAHHFYDRKGGILFRGDGGEYNAEAIASQVANRFAGKVWEEGDPPSVNGIPALSAHIAPSGIAAGPDGSIYLIHQYTGTIHILGFPEPTVLKITPDGNISTLPGFPAPTTFGDIVENVALGPDGGVYISNTTGGIGHRVLRYDPITQTATVVAGIQGTWGSGCNECPANTSPLFNPRGITVSQDGTLYIADARNQVVRKVDVNGIITTVAGIMGQTGFSGDGGPASSAKLNSPYGLALGPDGSLYIADTFNYRIRRVGPDGIITTVAGTNTQCASFWNSCGDGGPAGQAQLYMPSHISVGPEGSLFITDGTRVRRVSTTGIISALLSDPAAPPSVTWRYGGEGGPPARLIFGSKQTAVGPDGSLYISGGEEGVVLKIHAPLKGLDFGEFIVPSTDGSELYVFNAAGRHDRTLNANTNSIIFQFFYDSEGRLIKVDDAYGNPTLIERSGSAPAAIIGPFGQRTQLTVNGDGYLASIADPGGQTTSFTYTASGLMTGMTEPKGGNVHAFTYGADGRLTQDKDPANNVQTLTRSEFDTGYSVVHSTAEVRQTTYRVERLSNGNQRQTNTFPTGAITTNNLSTNGSESITFAGGSTSIPSKTPDPRFGLRSPLYKTTLKMPSNLEFNSESKRAVTLSDPSDLLSVQTITEETIFCPGCPDPRTYRLTYSAADKKYAHTTAEWRQKDITVNDQGSITRIDIIPGDTGLSIDPVTFTYNTQGFLTESVFGDTSQTFTHDPLGRVGTIANAAGETIGYGYDDANRVTAVTSPLGNSYGFNFDANSNLTQITMPSSAVHSLSYNSLNLLSGYTPPGGALPYAWNYNKDRDLTRTTLPGGRLIDISYDTGGRMSLISYPEVTVQLSYNDVTNRLSRITRTPSSGPAQQMDYTYDGSLLKSAIYSGVANGTYTYIYDNNYFLTALALDSDSISIVRDRDGLVTRYGDFNFGRETTLGNLSAIEDSGSGTHTLRIDYTYDALGRLAGRVHQVKTGVDGDGNPIYTPIFDLQLTRDNTGRITKKEDGSTYDYTYDADGQLTGVSKEGSPFEHYIYSTNGNRTATATTTASFDVQDRITDQGGINYVHNADGFMTQRGSDTLVYSARGELLEATAGGTTITYAYDGYGRRVGRKTGPENWYQYLYVDPQNAYPVTATRDPAGVLTSYHYDDFGHLFAFQRGGVWYYVATDQVGTPRVISDATGNIIKTLDFDSYGFLIADSNPGFDLPIGFAGGISDRVTGLVRFGARDYDPMIGRWTAKDPILFGGGQMNLYGYVGNNPVSLVDRKGKSQDLDNNIGGINGSKNSDYLNKNLKPKDYFDNSFIDNHNNSVIHRSAAIGDAWYFGLEGKWNALLCSLQYDRKVWSNDKKEKGAIDVSLYFPGRLNKNRPTMSSFIEW